MINSIQEFYNILPIIAIGAGIVISVIIELFFRKGETIIPWLTIIVFFFTGIYSIVTVENTSVVMQGMLATGGNVNIFYFIFNIGAALVCLLSVDYIKKYGAFYSEYYILIQNAVLGMMLLAGAKDLFTIFLGLELMSIPFYVLAGINRKIVSATEAALKYFLLGAFATGFVVYGIALMYGMAGTTSLDYIIKNFETLSSNLLFVVGALLFLLGFSFKIAAFPFHMWVPDVYQGSPTTVAGLFSTGGKAAAFSAIIVSLYALFSGTGQNLFTPYLSVIAVFSMLFGSIVAIAQTNIKRMLAYSSISHAGYLTIGLAAGNPEGVAGIIFYLAAYTFMNVGAFGIIALIEGKEETNLVLDSYAGLGNKYPVLAGALSLFMFSLAGIPPFAGFFGKYYVFIAAIKADLTWLAILGVISSVISVYFYLRIVVLMYFRTSDQQLLVEKSGSGYAAVMVSLIMVIVLGVLPGSFIEMISEFLR